MNAIEFLLKEHNKVRALLADINDSAHKIETKKKIFETLCFELIRHEEMEHRVWYPHFKGEKQLDHEVKHLISEEKYAEKYLKQFDQLSEDEWQNKFEKLKTQIEHHAQEEEQKLFPKVKKLFNDDELNKIGHEMYQFKKDYQQH